MIPDADLSEHHQALDALYRDLFRAAGGVGTDGFYTNMGYFEPGTANQSEASEALVEQVIGLLRRRQGMVLDVGCGLGGGTHHLGRYYPAGNIHAINISASQLEVARRHAPGSHFHLMPAEHLSFGDATFDAVVSVEAALHFQGRREFLAEARRVLKPGGEIAVADLLFREQPPGPGGFFARQEAYDSLKAYRALWEEAGFTDIACRDVTSQCWRGFIAYLRIKALRDLRAGGISADAFGRSMAVADGMAALPVTAYVLVHGTRPA
ncbi:methyltransferase domain-containing protein [Sphingomonas sp. QA11]|uniref:class I SAM-dependent methyltransferase n=1 Tax=Sphingomonas sp. QA11 TaxID=2950605 RepID=UPI00234960A1|nr:class I SAM-dependent methyltransferase [Sphingomonas sp. QA11]WCM26971.1 methyltransferase domain-containing protein [Sphingomonas sp. QA11]